MTFCVRFPVCIFTPPYEYKRQLMREPAHYNYQTSFSLIHLEITDQLMRFFSLTDDPEISPDRSKNRRSKHQKTCQLFVQEYY